MSGSIVTPPLAVGKQRDNVREKKPSRLGERAMALISCHFGPSCPSTVSPDGDGRPTLPDPGIPIPPKRTSMVQAPYRH